MLELYVPYGNVLMLRVSLFLGVFQRWTRTVSKTIFALLGNAIELCRFVGVLWIEIVELSELYSRTLRAKWLGKSSFRRRKSLVSGCQNLQKDRRRFEDGNLVP